MATFQELQQRMIKAQQRKLILQHLIDYLDSEFRSAGSSKPKKALLDENKVLIPESSFEDVSSELSDELALLDVEISDIKATSLVAPTPAPAAPARKAKNGSTPKEN